LKEGKVAELIPVLFVRRPSFVRYMQGIAMAPHFQDIPIEFAQDHSPESSAVETKRLPIIIINQSSKILFPYIFPNCCLAFPSALIF
jgi:hypothetical protein